MSRLEPWAEDVWTSVMPRRVLGADLRRRMVLIRLPDGALWAHSAVDLDDELKAEVDVLGPVAHIVAPNRYHHLAIPAWKAAYPDATVYAAPGLRERQPRVPIDVVLGAQAPATWGSVFEQHVVDAVPMMNEVVFLHRPSATLVITDLALHLPDIGSSPGAWLMGLMGLTKGVSGSFVRMLPKDRERLRASLAEILAWDFDAAVFSHGANLRQGAKAQVSRAFTWLGVP